MNLKGTLINTAAYDPNSNLIVKDPVKATDEDDETLTYSPPPVPMRLGLTSSAPPAN